MKSDVDIFSCTSGVEYLKKVYDSIRETNPRFSRRAFSAKLGIDQSMLTRYFLGVRLLSHERVDEISQKLGHNRVEAQYFKIINVLGDRGEEDTVKNIKALFIQKAEPNLQNVVKKISIMRDENDPDKKLKILEGLSPITFVTDLNSVDDIKSILVELSSVGGEKIEVVSTLTLKNYSGEAGVQTSKAGVQTSEAGV